jgi:hypothetical protein
MDNPMKKIKNFRLITKRFYEKSILWMISILGFASVASCDDGNGGGGGGVQMTGHGNVYHSHKRDGQVGEHAGERQPQHFLVHRIHAANVVIKWKFNESPTWNIKRFLKEFINFED